MLSRIAYASLRERRASVMLTLLSIVISVSLLVAVEFVRGQVKQSFTRTISGVDLIVGAPTGQLNLLLYSVFRMGNATSGIAWEQVRALEQHKLVDWVVPISLGDAHKGYRVVGTDNRYFEHFQYGDHEPLTFSQGAAFSNAHSAVIGSNVAATLNYQPGDKLVLSHGLGNVSFRQHEQHPFVVTGILAPTGTPVDKAVHVTLQGIEAMHEAPAQPRSLRKPSASAAEAGEQPQASHHTARSTSPNKGKAKNDNEAHQHTVPEQVTAAFVGLTSRAAALQLQYQLNQRQNNPVLAILPGMALSQLWSLMSNLERLLLAVSALILVASLIGLVTMLLASMRERRHEIAVLRAMGAGPATILWLIQAEALLISAFACVLAVELDALLFAIFSDTLSTRFGLFLSGSLLTMHTGIIIALVLAATWVCSFVPAMAAYRQALHVGLTQRG
ncbi:ABC transporter permease [Salinimonas marina]|uniref:ABC transporter permease n=1 Tax=Salinimonas marina TaxID=2785918 RepID=A0A7S9HDE5_9ALTE|nr:ABC transporter permease [Salinimonas marina]QPG05491.1 ABC transporter permease [Salinimonas marina]